MPKGICGKENTQNSASAVNAFNPCSFVVLLTTVLVNKLRREGDPGYYFFQNKFRRSSLVILFSILET